MKVKAIVPAGRMDVFNMEVEDTHDFAVQGGVIVHNCYDECRYICMENPIAMRIKPAPKPKPFDPLSEDDPAANNRQYAWYKIH